MTTPMVVLTPMVSTARYCQSQTCSIKLRRHEFLSCEVWYVAYCAATLVMQLPQKS